MGQWTPRKKGAKRIIGRVYSATPKDIERFCLRILLHHVPGPTCFEDLRTVNGTLLPSFKSACIDLQLLADDTIWDKTLSEAGTIQMPRQMRSLFATICLYCDPTDALKLWEDHKDFLTEDFNRYYPEPVAEQLSLQHIESLLQPDKSCSDLGLPNINTLEPNFHQQTIDSIAEMSLAEKYLQSLNEDQNILVQSIINDLYEINNGNPPKCKAYFLDGPGGTGKTWCYNTLISW